MDEEEMRARLKPTLPQIRKYINADPSLLEDIKNMLEYRDLRSEQAYYIRLQRIYELHDYMNPILRDAGEWDYSYWKEKASSMDHDRSRYHNRALLSFRRLAKEHEKNWNLSKIYFGRLLTPDEIDGHIALKQDIRNEMTDAMFELLGVIEDGVVIEKEANPDLKQMKTNMDKFNNDYEIKKSMTKDDSESKSADDLGMEFRFDSINSGTNLNENV